MRATRIYQMIRDRGYSGSVEQLRRVVTRLRPQPHEAFLRLQVFPAEQAQVDWAYFGSVMIGRAKRQLSCFVMTLSWSRALYLEFFFDQTNGKLLARPCARLPRLVRCAPGHPLRFCARKQNHSFVAARVMWPQSRGTAPVRVDAAIRGT